MLWVEVNKNKNKKHKRQCKIFRIKPRDFDRLTSIITLCSKIYLYMYNLITEKSFSVSWPLFEKQQLSVNIITMLVVWLCIIFYFCWKKKHDRHFGNGSFSFHADFYFPLSPITLLTGLNYIGNTAGVLKNKNCLHFASTWLHPRFKEGLSF